MATQKAGRGLSIAEISSFHIGGETVALSGQPKQTVRIAGDGLTREVDLNGSYVTGQLYAQRIRLTEPESATPVMFWHGGAMTGVTWETTPDGRPGWQWLFLEAGFDVVVSDAVERGRASWSPYPQIYATAPLHRTKEEAWSMFRFGPSEGFTERRAFSGQRFPVVGFDALCAQFVPRWTAHDAMILAAYEALLERTGPVHLVVHSQGGWLALNMAARRPELIASLALIEPAGAPAPDAARLAAAKTIPHLVMWGDYIDETPAWRRYRQPVDAYVAALARAGGAVEMIDLPREGVRGNSHVPMMDDNSAELADRVIAWLRERSV